MALTLRSQSALRFSLIFVWLVTGLVSSWEARGQSEQLLLATGVNDPLMVKILVWGGASVDLAIGLAMWFAPSRKVYLAALVTMLLMTAVATLLMPTLWLHPLGPLTKNVPIAVILLILARDSP